MLTKTKSSSAAADRESQSKQYLVVPWPMMWGLPFGFMPTGSLMGCLGR